MAIKQYKAENLEYNTPYTIVPRLTSTFKSDKEPNSWATPQFARAFARMYLDYYTSPDRLKQKNGLTLYEFVSLYRMPYKTFLNLRAKFPFVEDAVEYARGIIAMRRENGYETGDLTGKTAHMMRYYHSLWEDDLQDNRSFKLKLADKTKNEEKQVITIVKTCYNQDHASCTHEEPKAE